jgi:adenylate kinase family enzyme
MKIGILGAPGAGKTAFAKALDEELGSNHHVVDKYAESLRKRTGQEYGLMGNYLDDLQVVFKRREWELIKREVDTITCGTVLDSVAHCFVRTEDKARNSRELTLTSERLRTIAESLGLIYTESWDYDYAFYLPYMGEDPQSRLLDAALTDLIQTYAPPVLAFNAEVPDDKKASTAAKAIRTFEEKFLPKADERGVRSGDEAGKDDRDSAEPVPDVPEQGTDSNDA